MVWPISESVAGTVEHILGRARKQVNGARLLRVQHLKCDFRHHEAILADARRVLVVLARFRQRYIASPLCPSTGRRNMHTIPAPLAAKRRSLIKFLGVSVMFLVLLSPALKAQTNSLLIEDMTWAEVRDAIAAGKTTAIYYAGSTEPKSPGMAVG